MAQIDKDVLDRKVPEKSSFEPLSAGWYEAKIHTSELADTKAGGRVIKLRYDILGPTGQGRVVFGSLTLRNANPQAVEIGDQQRKDLVDAAGLGSMTDTDQLVGCSLQIKLAIRRSEEYGDSNEVKGFKPSGGGIPKIGSMGGIGATPAAAGTKAPWAK